MASPAKKALRKIKQPVYLFNEEIRHIRLRGYGLAVLSVLLIFLIFVVSHFTYSRSAQKYFEQQAYETMTEVSVQISRVVSIRMEHWYEQLDYSRQLVSSYAAVNATDRLLDEMGKINRNVFVDSGVVTKGGYVYMTDGTRFNLSAEPLIKMLTGERVPGRLAGTINSGVFHRFTNKILLAMPTAKQADNDDDSIVAVIAVLDSADVSELLNTDVFGNNMAYVVISDEKGNVIVDSTSQKHFGHNVLDTFSEFASQEAVLALRDNLQAGRRDTMDLSDSDTQFLTYYSPVILAEEAGGETGGEFSVLNWRLLILTRADVLTSNISSLFHESRLLLYAVLGVFGFSLLLYILLSTRRHINELTLRYVGSKTGLLHDTRFEQDADVLLRRNGPCYAVVSYNIVGFKLLNERFGHREGDEVLSIVGHTIKDFLSADETAAHSFADRFTVLMRMDTSEGFERIHSLEQCLVDANYPEQIHPRFTIGVYSLTPEDKDVFAAVDRARLAQTVAHERRSQISNIVIYTPEMSARRAEEGRLADMAESALKNHDFLVYYQLKRDLQHGGWAGSEALVRWKDPELGFIYPGKFVPVFERNGFIVKLDRYVFETVCRDLREAIDRGEKTVPVSINLSKCHFEEENFFDKYEEIMQRYAVPHELIEFEVTETLVAHDPEQIKTLIDRLHAIGCKCSLDDFGTGYSSLSMVQEFQFDVIKLDRSFFYGRNGFDNDSQLIVETLIALSHKLQKSVISEGIESEEQVDFLRAKHCDMIQGYYYAKPVCSDDYRRRLNEAE